MKNIHTKNLKGFTLIELIIVIAIMAILVAVTVISIGGLRKDTLLSRANSNARIVCQGIQNWLNYCEAEGIEPFIPKNGASSQFATICSHWDASPSITASYPIPANFIADGAVITPFDGYAMRITVIKEYQSLDNARGTHIYSGLVGKKLDDFSISPDLDRDIAPHLGNADLESMGGAWQAVIDVKNNCVLYAYWMSEGRRFVANEQRSADYLYSTTEYKEMELSQEFFFKNGSPNNQVGCYPLYDQLVQPAFS